ncbi:hypothetical protein K490DRAFT_72314 [Saccharata proteae CBS 121410]|uniref:Acyltransferase 3 domain-containing protein n=1 Tax=Saccharata proteae CBS 121410 TaxID=1314787 RepID=A0A6A5YCG6_9PEZI|nr:hypothetical protein K490DRAFT_72314 [Saccharata proteae CBS 121410]
MQLRCSPDSVQLRVRSASCLDGLRGIAALIVFFFHTLWAYEEFVEYGYGLSPDNKRIIQLPFIKILYAGHAMVSVFFVVGGYVISLKPLKLMRAHAWEDLHKALSSSVFRRGIRIYLPAIVATFISMLTLHFGLWEYPRNFIYNRDLINYADFHPDRAPTLGLQLLDWFYTTTGMMNVWSYYNSGFMMPYYNPYDPHLWTVPFEMRSSLVVAMTLLAVSRCRVAIRLFVVAAMIVFCCYWDRWECMLFLSGTILAESDMILQQKRHHSHQQEPENQPLQFSPSTHPRDNNSTTTIVSHSKPASYSKLTSLIPYALFLLGLYLLSAPNLQIPFTPGYAFLSTLKPASLTDEKRFLQGLGAITLVLSLTNSSVLQRPFLSPLAQYLGKISYSLYIVHGPLNHIVGLAVTPRLMVAFGAGGPAGWAWGAGFVCGNAAYAVVVLWVADVFQRAVDGNAVWLARKVEEMGYWFAGERRDEGVNGY